MVEEVVFMQMRIFRMFCTKHNFSAFEGNRMFEDYGVWTFIEESYDMLHLNGDEYVLDCVEEILRVKGVRI